MLLLNLFFYLPRYCNFSEVMRVHRLPNRFYFLKALLCREAAAKVRKAESHLQKKRLQSGLSALQANNIAGKDASRRAADLHIRLQHATAVSVLRAWKIRSDANVDLRNKKELISKRHRAAVLKSIVHALDWQVAETKAANEEAEVGLWNFPKQGLLALSVLAILQRSL